MNKAIILDRDGVVIENVPTYVRAWADVAILPGVLSALACLRETNYKIVIVTNQSVVGRGIISLETAHEINVRLLKVIQDASGRVDDLFMCPHAPQDGCNCRKPQPGLILQAASALAIDLDRSILVGDALTDIQAGQTAGVRTNVMVLTGRGAEQVMLPAAKSLAPFQVYNSLGEVVAAILAGLLS